MAETGYGHLSHRNMYLMVRTNARTFAITSSCIKLKHIAINAIPKTYYFAISLFLMTLVLTGKLMLLSVLLFALQMFTFVNESYIRFMLVSRIFEFTRKENSREKGE